MIFRLEVEGSSLRLPLRHFDKAPFDSHCSLRTGSAGSFDYPFDYAPWAQAQGFGFFSATANSGRASEFFVAFDDKGRHNFVGISGIDNFEPTKKNCLGFF